MKTIVLERVVDIRDNRHGYVSSIPTMFDPDIYAVVRFDDDDRMNNGIGPGVLVEWCYLRGETVGLA